MIFQLNSSGAKPKTEASAAHRSYVSVGPTEENLPSPFLTMPAGIAIYGDTAGNIVISNDEGLYRWF